MSDNKVNLYSYINKGVNIIFHISVVIILIGYLIDIITFESLSRQLVYINIITVFLIVVLFVLFRLKKINLKLSFGIILYSTIFNILFETLSDPFMPARLSFLMRDALFVIIILSLAALVVHKIHSIILGVFFVFGISIYTIITGNPFLKNSIFLIVLIIASYAAVIYYFVSVLERAIAAIEDNNRTIKEQNEVVNKSYELLVEREHKIQKQSKELIEQSKILQEQSDLLQEQNAELFSLVATKDKFFSILAHDLRNPFNTILGFAELLSLKFDKLDDSKKRNYVANIKNIATKTYGLLESLLLWARTQTGKMENNPQNVQISLVLDSCMSLFHSDIEQKQLKLINNIDDNCNAYCDIDQAEIIFRNLLSNAIKYTPVHGTISFDYTIKRPFVEITITDNGIGLTDEQISNLFRIEKSRKIEGTKSESGAGLGLVICNELIKLQGGAFWVKSKPEHGSAFTFTLLLEPDSVKQ